MPPQPGKVRGTGLRSHLSAGFLPGGPGRKETGKGVLRMSSTLMERTGMAVPGMGVPGMVSPGATSGGVSYQMVPRCTFKVERCQDGMKVSCVCDDQLACSTMQNLCSVLAG